MLNKILSKKIIFSLSLRGLFSFCHSRESGNPSSLSLRGAKRRSNLSGFSLIELMVAIAILAIAIFGIFHAYSAGFMGMADARDRTVATNYAREAMEDIKNKDFDQIITQSRNYIDGTKYEREVIVQPSTNLKKVITNVYWKDRNGNEKIVETGMAIHFIETTAGTPTRIMLIANPYNILTIDDINTTDVLENRSIIAAVVKDAKGNTVNTYNNNITFTLNDSNNSSLIDSSGDIVGNTYSINAVEGIAVVTFEASVTEGDVTIEASDSGLTPDSVTIKVTDPAKPVKINLTASPTFMTPESISIITATVVNAGGATVESATNEITFSVSDPDLGTLSNQSLLVLGVATIDLNSSAIPGTITVTVSSSGLEPGVVDVITGGQISLSALPSPVHNEEKSEITVTTKDANGVPINYVGNIQLYISPNTVGSGIFEDNSSATIIIYFNGFNPSKNITFVASIEGTVIISATDQEGILDSGSITLNIIDPLIPEHILVTAEPLNIEIGGSSSTITAVMKTSTETGNKTITSYNGPVYFETTFGELYSEYTNFIDGFAYATLDSSGTAEIAIITVSSDDSLTGSIEVGFYVQADRIDLIANPQSILAGGQTCIITATIKDGPTVISGYNGAVTFSIIEGYPNGVKFTSTNQSSIIISASGGEAVIQLQSKNWAGTAKIRVTAYEGILNLEQDLNIPVGIALDLVPGSVSYSPPETENIVSYEINVQGSEVLLEEMQVSWQTIGDPPETLDKIDIAGITIYDNDLIGSIVYTYNLNERVADVNVSDISLPTGTSTIVMYFSGDISDRTTLDVTFNPNSGDYLVDLILL